MTRREEVIVSLLERHAELSDPHNGPSGVRGDGQASGMMPPTYTASVKELERLLAVMRDERRSQWWHVSERYLKATRTRRTLRFKRGRWHGLEPHQAVAAVPGGWTLALATDRKADGQFDVMVTTWNPLVRAEKVRRGVAWLAVKWGLPHEPFEPTVDLKVAA